MNRFLQTVILIALPVFLFAQEGVPLFTPDFPPQEFTGRREKIYAAIGDGFFKVLGIFRAGGVLDAIAQGRRHFHSTVLVDRLGEQPWLADGPQLGARLHAQVQALTSADLYWVVALVALAFIPLIAWMPTRIHPPRAVA